jgi:GNAT superfamily N-acetyltransferase
MPAEPTIRWGRTEADLDAAHDVFLRRIGARLVEDRASFAISATVETPDWIPRLALAEVGGELAGAQLGGLLPAVALLSLPYTAVAEPFEGQGVYRRLKEAMIAALRAEAHARNLPEPAGNVSEEVAGSAQYRRKVERGIASVLPVAYRSPAAQGLDETPLALTYEPLTDAPPPASPDALRAIVAAVYRGLYRIADPERDPAFQRTVASLGHVPDQPPPA